MRHRITSFRCVEAKANVSLLAGKRKTCNAVNIRQFSCASPAGATSDAAIFHYARDLRPGWDDERRRSRHAHPEPPAAERDCVEQGVERRHIGAEALRRRIEARRQIARQPTGPDVE